jgi:hypothetical protein
MIVEEVYKNNTPFLQRRPNGHMNASGGTKRGNKRRSIRRQQVGLLNKECGSDDDNDEVDDSEVGR